ncbi:MAG: hypothetical protein HZC41_11310 [Chloroflexi bacterium]|nr:hypothetical protein [Chloroflexota bacterium]
MEILLAPPIAFLIYLVLVGILSRFGKSLAPNAPDSPLKRSTYGSGEEAAQHLAAPGYKPFFRVALFFAVLHLGVLVLGSGSLTGIEGVYLAGLGAALLALILG